MHNEGALKWETYDPAWLVALAKEQYPDEPCFAEALARCTRRAEGCPSYMYFVDPKDVNQPGAEWQFDQNIMLESDAEGMLILDVLKDGRIGGVEFVTRPCMDKVT
jgi:hypothetical protein